jgi:hypothetical protein
MLRMGLLTSTAMTAVALLLSGVPGAYARTDMHVASRDPNMRFLCTYGQFVVSAFSAFHSGGHKIASAWEHVAVPVTGRGQTVSRIRVIESPSEFMFNPSFTTGIYSNTASGFPGQLIAGGTGRVGASCGPVTIKITPTTLKRHTTYWIEETTAVQPRCPTSMWPGSDDSRRRYRPSLCSGYSSWNSLYWVADPSATRNAYVQTHWWHKFGKNSSSSTSPWTEQSTGPYFKLK